MACDVTNETNDKRHNPGLVAKNKEELLIDFANARRDTIRRSYVDKGLANEEQS